jgi:UDP-glucose:(glucosyl)LPS alpha-1,2-glucosyltransferase
MVNDVNKVFKFNDFGDAVGGTEIQVANLLKNIDNDILKKYDIIVAHPSNDFIKDPERTSMLWIHDLPDDPSFTSLKYADVQNQYDYFIFVSHWQKEMFRIKFNIPFHKCIVIKNGIDGIDMTNDKKFEKVDKVKISYTSNPSKGLAVLYEVYKELYDEFGDKIELNVFSNFDFYGEKHKVRNEQYEGLYQKMRDHEGINYHGSVDHDVLIDNMKSTHIWSLPSIFPETSCMSLMEAMSSKCVCVHNDLGALAETSANFGIMYRYVSDINVHAEMFYVSMKNAITTILTSPEVIEKHLLIQKLYADSFYSWEIKRREWELFFKSL